MRSIPLLSATIFLMSGCAVSSAHDPAFAADISPAVSASASATAPNALTLANSHWRFTEIAGIALPSGVNATLEFDANGHVSGHAGCNSYGGAYHQEPDGALHFGAILSTKMACLQPTGAMQAEQGAFGAMRRTARARMDGAGLVLLDASGMKLATLQTQS